jgi:S-adenosylmethionine:tRNA ribosyltransferase-isomerase
MRVDDFDFELPPDRIALHPAEPRDSARMLVVHPDMAPSDRKVTDLLDLLAAGDVLVVNDTKVLPAELHGIRVRDGLKAQVSFNLHKRDDAHTWRAFARPSKKLKILDRIDLGAWGRIKATVTGKGETGEVTLSFELGGEELDAAIREHGVMPLPPYIESKRPAEERDKVDYQTVYATREGAVAAPTAGLHFTQILLQQLAGRGVGFERLTLHVGAGTFLPVKAEETSEHRMHAEWGSISAATADALNAARAKGGRIVAVGTTSLRLLESATTEDGRILPFDAETSIFITPGYRFRAVDILLTNFHLPRSTLFMLVSAFSGLDTMKHAYAHAISKGYRFYSYGDACLLFRGQR